MLSREEILNGVDLLAQELNAAYKDKFPVFVCVLKGANVFFQDLLNALQLLKMGYTVEFMRVSSYEGTSSTGEVKIGSGLDPKSLANRHVILIEDIVDTGTSLSKVVPFLAEQVPLKSIKVCTLLDKRLPITKKFEADYMGFSIPDHFIVGYGLDYNELYRDVKDIWVISQAGIDFDSTKLFASE